MQNTQVSFKSNIRLASANRFAKEIAGMSLKNAVSSPWTAKEMVVGQKAYTTRIYDCLAGGITDGKKVVMFHICPTYEENKDFSTIERTILENFNEKTAGLRGVIVGNKPEHAESNSLLENFRTFMKKNNIDFSLIRGVKKDDESSILFDVNTDTWTITNTYLAREVKKGTKFLRGILERSFKEVNLSKNDKLVTQ